MSAALPAVVLTPGVQKQISLINIPNVSALKVTNGTPFDITYSGFGVQGSSIIPAGLEYMLYAQIKNAGYLNVLAVNNAGVSGNGVVNLVVYDTGEQLPPGVWPVSVPTQTVSATVSTVQTLSNESATLGTLVIDMGVPGNTNLLQIYNDGHFTWSVLQSGVLHVLATGNVSGNPLQLGQAGDIVEVKGSFTVDQNVVITGTASMGTATFTNGAVFTGGDINLGTHGITASGIIVATSIQCNAYNDSAGNGAMVITPGTVNRIQNASQIAFQVPGGTTIAGVTSSGMSANGYTLNAGSGTYGMYTNGISRISTGTYTSATVAHATNHGLGAVPSLVIITGASSTGSSSGGADTYTATQFTSVEGFAGVLMRFVAIRF